MSARHCGLKQSGQPSKGYSSRMYNFMCQHLERSVHSEIGQKIFI